MVYVLIICINCTDTGENSKCGVNNMFICSKRTEEDSKFIEYCLLDALNNTMREEKLVDENTYRLIAARLKKDYKNCRGA